MLVSTPRNQSGFDYHHPTKGAENSEHSLSSSTSSIISTLDKLREKLSQPTRNELNYPSSYQSNFGTMQISPFGFLMPQTSHPTMFPNDVTGLNYQMCNSGPQEKSRELKHASKEESVSSARVGHNSKFPAEKETAPQTLSSAAAGSTSLADKVGFSPMDLVKLAEKPVASSGLTLRTRNSASSSSTPRRVPRKPNSGKSREAADGSNLRRSKSLVSARRSEMPPEPTVVPPKNISWDDGSPELLRNQPQIQGSLFEALSHEDRGQICGVGGAFHSPQTFPFQIESQSRLQNNSPDSVVSFQCSTCVPKPLKQRSKPSTPRSRPLLKTSENPPGIITNSDNTDLDYKTKIPPFPDFEFAKLPNSVATIHQGLPAHFASASNPLLFTSQSVGEPTLFRSLPSPNSNPVTARPPLSSRVTPRNETPKVEFNQHSRSSPERPWITHASASESKSSHVSVVPVKTPSHLGPTTDRTKHLTSKSTYTSTSVSKFTPSSVSATAHVPKLEPATVAYTSPNPSPGFTTKTVEAQKVSNSPGVVASDVVGSLPSQRMPSSGKVAKASPGVTEGRIAQHPQHEIQQQSVPPINVCTTTTSNNNESYISAFDHLPLRCSTPRSLIPSHRPSTGATSDRQGGSSNHMSSGKSIIARNAHKRFKHQSFSVSTMISVYPRQYNEKLKKWQKIGKIFSKPNFSRIIATAQSVFCS